MHDAISKQSVIIKNIIQKIARIFLNTLRDLCKYTKPRASIYGNVSTLKPIVLIVFEMVRCVWYNTSLVLHAINANDDRGLRAKHVNYVFLMFCAILMRNKHMIQKGKVDSTSQYPAAVVVYMQSSKWGSILLIL